MVEPSFRYWPQVVLLASLGFDIGATAYLVGRGESIRPSLIVSIVHSALLICILYFGGFFAAWGWAP